MEEKLGHSKAKRAPLKKGSKFVFLVMDGLGGIPHPKTSRTELETANTPNLDKLARMSRCGLIHPIIPGYVIGSLVGHLSLFGYETNEMTTDRGVVEALGIGFPLKEGDIAARGNFVTVDKSGEILDRRAGRLETEKTIELLKLLQEEIKLEGVEFFLKPIKDYRFLLVLRGANLSALVTSSDPSEAVHPDQTDLFPLEIRARKAEAESTARLLNQFILQARAVLASQPRANMLVLRGISKMLFPQSMLQKYGLKGAAIVGYPTYAGISRLVGMDVFAMERTHRKEIDALKRAFRKDYNFYFLHFKEIDSAGEDGDFERKVSVIEEVDSLIPEVLELDPEIIVVTGDHATPAVLKHHSGDPVPILMYHKGETPVHRIEKFGERECGHGDLSFIGRVNGPYVRPAVEMMRIALGDQAVRSPARLIQVNWVEEEMKTQKRISDFIRNFPFLTLGYIPYRNNNDLKRYYIEFMDSSKKQIRIVAGEFGHKIFGDTNVIDAMKRALDRNVSIELISGPEIDKESKDLKKLINDKRITRYALPFRPDSHIAVFDIEHARVEYPHSVVEGERQGYFARNAPSLAADLNLRFEELKSQLSTSTGDYVANRITS